METFSALLALCVGNSPVTGEFPSQRPVIRSFDVFFDLCLNKRLSKQSRRWWFETPSRSLWRHCNDEYSPSSSSPASYVNSHHKYNTVSPHSYLYNRNPNTWKANLFIETGPWPLYNPHLISFLRVQFVKHLKLFSFINWFLKTTAVVFLPNVFNIHTAWNVYFLADSIGSHV